MYDAIIVGSGLGGLSAGLKLALNNKKVLILEKNSLPGGSVKTIKKGRFMFDVGLSELYDFGSFEKKGSIRNIFQEYGVDLDASVVNFNLKIKVADTSEEYIIQGETDSFMVLLEKLKSGSAESLKQLLKIIKDMHECYMELKEGKQKFEDDSVFLKYIDMNTIDALNSLKMPKETINRLGYLWVYLGSPLDKLSFCDFAEFMYKLIFKKQAILKKKNVDMIMNMVNRYQELGGKIYYRANVVDISDKGLYKLVTTDDGNEYKAKDVICDVAKRYVFQNLILEENKDIYRLENARTLAPNGVTILVGLNKDCNFLGLKHYQYYHYQNMNSTINVKSMNKLYHGTWNVSVPNIVNEFASPKNTTILVIQTTYFNDAFGSINKNEYNEVKEEIAINLIEQFENTFHIDIREYIEEMEIITPLDVAKYTNAPDGSIMGYMRKGYDNAINRVINYQSEIIPNLYFVGGSALFGGGADNAIASGYYVANQVLTEREDFDGK